MKPKIKLRRTCGMQQLTHRTLQRQVLSQYWTLIRLSLMDMYKLWAVQCHVPVWHLGFLLQLFHIRENFIDFFFSLLALHQKHGVIQKTPCHLDTSQQNNTITARNYYITLQTVEDLEKWKGTLCICYSTRVKARGVE